MIVERPEGIGTNGFTHSLDAMEARYRLIRSQTESLCEPLEVEDYIVQSMEDASPTRWHIAHTTWFFETFVLRKFMSGYHKYNDVFPYLFNSYYVQAGERFSRPHRGMLTRPTVREVMAYRSYVDGAMDAFFEGPVSDEALRVLEIGLNHEQQHQELMLTDLKHMLSQNPLYPAYCEIEPAPAQDPGAAGWTLFEGGLVEIGTNDASFHFDNEGPRHRYFLEPFEIANRLVTNGEFMEFIEDGGYHKPELWLSEGYAVCENESWKAPPYWVKKDNRWYVFTLGGLSDLNWHEPVSQISYFEADAYARWAGYRLATEFEWEEASRSVDMDGNFVEKQIFHPVGFDVTSKGQLQQMFGNLWEWTSSQYSAYPGYQPEEGALGEYNGKFMCNQFVLRGGSFATSETHIRRTYRNFFPPYARWQFTGIRLARDAKAA